MKITVNKGICDCFFFANSGICGGVLEKGTMKGIFNLYSTFLFHFHLQQNSKV